MKRPIALFCLLSHTSRLLLALALGAPRPAVSPAAAADLFGSITNPDASTDHSISATIHKKVNSLHSAGGSRSLSLYARRGGPTAVAAAVALAAVLIYLVFVCFRFISGTPKTLRGRYLAGKDQNSGPDGLCGTAASNDDDAASGTAAGGAQGGPDDDYNTILIGTDSGSDQAYVSEDEKYQPLAVAETASSTVGPEGPALAIAATQSGTSSAVTEEDPNKTPDMTESFEALFFEAEAGDGALGSLYTRGAEARSTDTTRTPDGDKGGIDSQPDTETEAAVARSEPGERAPGEEGLRIASDLTDAHGQTTDRMEFLDLSSSTADGDDEYRETSEELEETEDYGYDEDLEGARGGVEGSVEAEEGPMARTPPADAVEQAYSLPELSPGFKALFPLSEQEEYGAESSGVRGAEAAYQQTFDGTSLSALSGGESDVLASLDLIGAEGGGEAMADLELLQADICGEDSEKLMRHMASVAKMLLEHSLELDLNISGTAASDPDAGPLQPHILAVMRYLENLERFGASYPLDSTTFGALIEHISVIRTALDQSGPVTPDNSSEEDSDSGTLVGSDVDEDDNDTEGLGAAAEGSITPPSSSSAEHEDDDRTHGGDGNAAGD